MLTADVDSGEKLDNVRQSSTEPLHGARKNLLLQSRSIAGLRLRRLIYDELIIHMAAIRTCFTFALSLLGLLK